MVYFNGYDTRNTTGCCDLLFICCPAMNHHLTRPHYCITVKFGSGRYVCTFLVTQYLAYYRSRYDSTYRTCYDGKLHNLVDVDLVEPLSCNIPVVGFGIQPSLYGTVVGMTLSAIVVAGGNQQMGSLGRRKPAKYMKSPDHDVNNLCHGILLLERSHRLRKNIGAVSM